MKICENCKNYNDGTYGSGRFCSQKCARGFGTKANRAEINEKVSKTLMGRKLSIDIRHKISNANKNRFKSQIERDKISKSCQTYFKNNPEARTKIANFMRKNTMSEETRLKISKTVSYNRSLGKFKFNSIKCEFPFNDTMIRCDSKLEFRGLKKFCQEFTVECIERSQLIIPYTFENKIRHFNPDFVLILNDGTKIIFECKSKISKNKTNKEIRPLYFLTVEHKMKSLKEFCALNNYKCFIFNGSKITEI